MLPFQQRIFFAISCCLHLAFAEYNLHLLHVNDIHARFEQTDKRSGRCSQEDLEKQDCFGGVARLKKKVDDLKEEHENVIFVNAGDFYQGTIWYTKFKWEVVAKFANMLNFTAMSPGNHEFDDKVDGFLPFLREVRFPMVSCNIDDSALPENERISDHIQKSVMIELNGRKIGIIGYVTPETTALSQPGKVKFLDEIESINEEANNLKKQGVKIIIAVGHSGFRKDKEIAKNCPDVDVVVGGHSNTFLYTGDKPSSEKIIGPYPTEIKQTSGKIVPVVQAYAYTKYLGHLVLTFDDDGNLDTFNGNPILLTQDLPQDENVLDELKPWKEQIKEYSQSVIGIIDESLNASRIQESSIGNFVADSMVYYYETKYNIMNIAMINSGAIRTNTLGGNITTADLLEVFPFENSIDIVELRGSTIRQILKRSAGLLPKTEEDDPHGGFIQVSGIQMTIDLCKNEESITKLQVKNDFGEYEDLNDTRIYNVTMPTYLANGGDGYKIIKADRIKYTTGDLDTDVLKEYIDHKYPSQNNNQPRIGILCPFTPPPGPLDSNLTSNGQFGPLDSNLSSNGQFGQSNSAILTGFSMVVIFHLQKILN